MRDRDDELGDELRAAFGEDLPGRGFDRAVLERIGERIDRAPGAARGSPRSRRAPAWLMPAVAAGVLLVLAVQVWLRAAPRESARAPQADELISAGEDGERFRARVTDARGHPIEGATVIGVVKTWPGGRYQQVPYDTKTDADGWFELKQARPAAGQFAVAAAFFKSGYAYQSHYEFLKEGAPMSSPVLALRAAHPVRLRFLDREGKPAGGVTAIAKSRKTAQGAEHLVYEMAAATITETSDVDGLVRLACLAPGDVATVSYRFPGGVGQARQLEIRGEENETFEIRQADDKPPPAGPTPGPHLPQEDLRAGDDENKRYFLIGPTAEGREPAKGRPLLVVLPGGGGGADFNPFVKRILQNALDAEWLVAQPVAFKWTDDQEIVWPTGKNKVRKQKFSTEAFIDAVIEDASSRKKIDPKRVFALGWSSSGPALYATSLAKKTRVRGFFIAMSVFRPNYLPSLKRAKGTPYFIYHSRDDRVCPFRMAEEARDKLGKKGAKVEFVTYDGGHGWHGNVYGNITRGISWLEKHAK